MSCNPLLSRQKTTRDCGRTEGSIGPTQHKGLELLKGLQGEWPRNQNTMENSLDAADSASQKTFSLNFINDKILKED